MSEVMRHLIAETGLTTLDIRRIIITAPSRYKAYLIPKRRGGFREIAQPAKEVKALQRVVMDRWLRDLPVHESATAYRKGLSILDNAKPHTGGGAVLKMDFANFFPSIRARDWIHFCKENAVFSEDEDIAITSRLLFYRRKGSTSLRLSIGAPTSPILSNILMRHFDERVTEKVAQLSRSHITYTRYADDLTFSAPRTGYLQEVPRAVKAIVRATRYPKLSIHPNKTVLATRKYKRFVTGLVLSNDGRVTIGRERKRTVRATVHSAMRGLLSEEQKLELLGMLAYIHSVEPAFTRKLMEWYGADFIQVIRSSSK